MSAPLVWVVIPIFPVLGKVSIGLSNRTGTYPLLSLNLGLLKYADPDCDVNLALYNLNVISCVWSSVQRAPFWDLNIAPMAYCVE